jgi:hypothetical protein
MRYFRFDNVTGVAREIATHIFTQVQYGLPVGEIRLATDEVPSADEWFCLDTDGLKEQAFNESCGRYKLIDLAQQFDTEDAHIIAGGYLGGNALATTGLIDRSTGVLTMEDAVRTLIDYLLDSVEQTAPTAFLLQLP